MALNIGRKGRLYVVKEAGTQGGNGAGYGQLQDGTNGSNTLSAAARAMRHLDFKATFDPFDRQNSQEKKTSPGHVYNFDRRTKAALGSLGALVRPSGVIGTIPESDPVFEAAFGSKTNPALSTTIASAPTTGGATLTSAGTLAKGDAVLLIVAGKKYVRFLTSVAGAAVTWAPLLPGAPAGGSAVKSAITYKLTTDLAISLAFLHVLSGFRRELRGAGIDKFSLNFDANSEVQYSASGPAANQLSDAAAVADPGAFTQVGGNPPSGIIGDTLIGDVSYLIKKGGVDLNNGLAVRNEEWGSNADSGIASELYRQGRREISVNLDAYVETAASLYDLSKAGTNASFFNQAGRTEGNIVATYAPIVYWKPADTDSPEGPSNWSFKGMALESADGANDELYFALA